RIAPRPFPASISTPVSAEEPARPAPASPRRPALAKRGRATMARVRASASAAVDRFRGIRRPSIGTFPKLPLPGRAVLGQARRTVGSVGGFVTAHKNRLRVSGLLTLSGIAVALAAYGGGALLTSVTGLRAGAATPAAAKLATAPEKPARQGPALVSPLTIT